MLTDTQLIHPTSFRNKLKTDRSIAATNANGQEMDDLQSAELIATFPEKFTS